MPSEAATTLRFTDEQTPEEGGFMGYTKRRGDNLIQCVTAPVASAVRACTVAAAD
jgi:hypothetical protein